MTITINAYQHIFTVVGWEDLPKKRDGMQTLYCDPKITTSELDELEERSIYPGGVDGPVKWQYYRLSSGKFVVSRSLPLIRLDEAGRTGTFLTHNFIFEEDEWKKVSCNPF